MVTVLPIAFEISADAEGECQEACTALLRAHTAFDSTTTRPVQGADRRWRSVVRLKRGVSTITDLPDWAAEG
jgi:hypothetical protein